jgi:hypothetical protein
VDELCKAILIIFSQGDTPNKNYHTFSNQPLSLDKTINLFSSHFGFKKPKLVSPQEFIKKKSTYVQQQLMKYNFYFLSQDVTIDSEMTNDFLASHNFIFSSHHEESLLKIADYCMKVGFLKKSYNINTKKR